MKRFTLTILVLLMSLNLVTNELFAVTQGFTVGATVTDNVAPSQPTGLSATGVSSSRIDLSWTASTDNVLVTGYHIYRGGIVVATSTGIGTTYSDTGLSASTLYSYNVAAIDAAGNESAQSVGAMASTLAPTVTPQPTPSGGNGGGGQYVSTIYGVTVTPGETTLKIEWKTTVSTQGTIWWGKTADYGLGATSEVFFATTHSIVVSGLTPGSDYLLRIEARDENGHASVVNAIPARTLASNQSGPLANVTNFSAAQKGSGIDLSWVNPNQSNFEAVRIVKSEKFFPTDPNDGEVIYEGRGEKARDVEVKDGVVYYYTAFTRDSLGNWSSGAVASAKYFADGHVEGGNPLDQLPQSPIIDSKIDSLTLRDFIFSQDGKAISFAEAQQLLIDGTKNLKISLAYDKVPEILKTIAVTFTDPNDATKVFTFLLKVNEDKSAYEAVIAPLEKAGEYALNIAVIDYKNRGLKKLEGSLLATAEYILPQGSSASNSWTYLMLMIEFLKLLSLIALLIKLIEVFLKSWRVPVFAKANIQKNPFKQ